MTHIDGTKWHWGCFRKIQESARNWQESVDQDLETTSRRKHEKRMRKQEHEERWQAARRSGKPRKHWLSNTFEEAYNETTPDNIEEFDPTNEHHINWVVQAAINRDDRFETKPFKDNLNIFKTPNEDI